MPGSRLDDGLAVRGSELVRQDDDAAARVACRQDTFDIRRLTHERHIEAE